MSLMIPSSASPERLMVCTKRRWRASSDVLSTSSVIPSTPFIGVRISWLIVARNSLFARLAASAWSLASCNSRVRACTLASRSR